MPFNKIILGIVENNGPDNLRDTLRDKLKNAKEVSIAVAFVTVSGLKKIIQPLRDAASKGSVRFITGLYQYVTEPDALEMLLEVQVSTRKRFRVHLSNEEKFHRKYYLLKTSNSLIAITGSSNLTKDGLESGGELNLISSLNSSHILARRLTEVFHDEWDSKSEPLDKGQITRYRRLRPKTKIPKSPSKSKLKEILGKPTRHDKAELDSPEIRYWRDSVTGYAAKKTEVAIKDATSWDRQGYYWFSTGGKPPYNVGDKVFLFDFTNKSLRLIRIKGIAAPLNYSTPDGRNFAAFGYVNQKKKKLIRSFWKELHKEGITRDSAQRLRKLDDKEVSGLTHLLKG